MLDRRKLVALGILRGGGAAAITNLFRSVFGTSSAAPIPDPLTCEVGELDITDTANKYTIAGGKLLSAGVTSSNSDPKAIRAGSSLAWVAGRAVDAVLKGASIMLGWEKTGDTTIRAGLQLNKSVGKIYAIDAIGSFPLTEAYSPTSDYRLSVIQRGRGYGFYLIVQGGDFASPSLLWITELDDTYPADTVSTRPHNTASGTSSEVSDWTVRDRGGVWGKKYGLASHAIEHPTTSDVLNAPADTLIEFKWTPVAAETLELSFRRTDDDNRWILRMFQATGSFELIERNAGTETQRFTGTTNGAGGGYVGSFRFILRAIGSEIIFGGYQTTIRRYGSATFNQTQTGGKITFGGALEYLAAYPISITTPITYNNTSKRIWGYGDSKTYGAGDSNVSPSWGGGYIPALVSSLETSTGFGWSDTPYRIGASGQNVAYFAANVASHISSAKGTPDYVLVNIGTNDNNVSPGAGAAAWVSNYGIVLDAIHTAYPSAVIMVAKLYRSDTSSAILAEWNALIDTVVSTRAWASVGIDENNFLPGNLYDAVHPNHAGYMLTAAAWKSAMGY